jgi:DNA phosphorothioation system restriction enzyme
LNLRKIKLKETYNSNNSNLIDDFYIPCLRNSIEYKRAVGYFTSNSLALAAKGLTSFFDNNGKMKLIASPVLDSKDVEAIEKGYRNRNELIEKKVLKEFEDINNNLIEKRLSFLSWLISKELLDIKLAFYKNRSLQAGIYHEKMGIFEDEHNNIAVFSGSSNETFGGLYSNYESFDVFRNWVEYEKNRTTNKYDYFNRLWNNNLEKLEVVDFTEVTKDILKKYEPNTKPFYDPESKDRNTNRKNHDKNTSDILKIPDYISLRDYQKEAIKKWFSENGKGILRMATGTGKTITSLAAIAKLKEIVNEGLFIVVVCPFQHLVDQWNQEMKKFGIKSILAYDSKNKWLDEAHNQIFSFNQNHKDIVSIITTKDTFTKDYMQKTIERANNYRVLIADEVHYMGSPNIIKKLNNKFNYRLGLSATPFRWFDEEGTEKLLNYFGKGVIYEYGLEKAISDKFLTRYYYYPIIVKLTEEENEKYHKLTKKISRFSHSLNSFDDIYYDNDETLKRLLIKRAKLIKSASQKLSILKKLVKENYPSKHNIFYCGSGMDGDQRQIDLVQKMLGQEIGMKVHPFTSRENNKKRKEILINFEKGNLEGLVAIKCLDEGVDIPATKTAYLLASSTNPREFTQRRGRILRKHHSKKFAYIYDFIVIPNDIKDIKNLDPKTFNIERKLVEKELKRFIEFANLAVNGPEAQSKLLEIKKSYNLLHL